ncbi:MAG: sucrose synthase [Desulfobulbaceae bacterium]|uniref:Sucrose synthase n=1 Tax=Candidatus Desulfatifera sulfidica TaxID=2841691 RepID=A0A8J6NC91_9BACT|nr:sucrose synthase [Candidatus Desulfatifera sulfidica]
MISLNQEKLIDQLHHFLAEERPAAQTFFHEIRACGRPLMLQTELRDLFQRLIDEDKDGPLSTGPLRKLVYWGQEAVIYESWVYFALRSRAARWLYLRVQLKTLALEIVSSARFLLFKERLVTGCLSAPWNLEVDFAPFSREFFKLQEEGSIGKGVEFLNRRLSSGLFSELERDDNRLLRFLKLHRYRDQQLLLSPQVNDNRQLRCALRDALRLLKGCAVTESWSNLSGQLHQLGFAPGWGRNAGIIRETLSILLDILEAPSPDILERFLSRIPMIFSIAVISPHGFFGQDNVLGRPDTGGQVVYILDQVRALEQEMRSRLQDQGLDIEPQIVILTRLIPEAEGSTCDQPLEKVVGTKNCRILRVPFRSEQGEVLPQWISRFEVWPYLEQFAQESELKIVAELQGKPDLVVGNYSDGNLVASLLAHKLGVTQCNIAHALEKAKYLYSDLYWQENEAQYHFSCQFTADLIAMNAADFIITSSYQEIAGTDENPGQYESYMTYTMPNLYRVINGIDVYSPKFNIVSPGADPEIYFAAQDQGRRLVHLQDKIRDLIFGSVDGDWNRGSLMKTDKPLILTIARLDRIKNLTGLVRLYGRNERLREQTNLLIVGGHVNSDYSHDVEEVEEIQLMHRLFDEYGLDGQVRWLGMHLDKQMAGEMYRLVADGSGAFVQPALFEAFGLTVIEAMSSGLPTFATCFGGPMEIIEHGISGFHINPNYEDEAAELLVDFFNHCQEEPEYWQKIAQGGLQRIEARYTWKRYAERMMTFARIYGFWRYVSNLEQMETRRYLEMFYNLQFRPLARQLAVDENE